jgi:hypothetical protein
MAPVHWRDLEKIFLATGFTSKKPGVLRPVVIPTYDEVPVSIIKNNLKTAGISREEYFRLLGEN